MKIKYYIVDSSCLTLQRHFQYYDTILGVDTKLLDKADKTDTYPKAEVNVAIIILQAGIHRRVLTNAVDIQSKFK